MKTCSHCGGAVMEPGKTYGYCGPVCHCMWDNGQLRYGYRTPEDYQRTVKVTQDEVDKFMKDQMEKRHREFIKRPSYSHILNLCEQLTAAELKAFIGLLTHLHDSKVKE